jgi:hypothetical protein
VNLDVADRVGSGGGSRQLRIPIRDIGVLPLLCALPFMYYPKVLDGDTQPWVLLAALVALVSYRRTEFVARRDLVVLVLALLCVAVYGLRSDLNPAFIRQAYIYVSFAALWVIVQRDRGDYLVHGIRITITLWFLVGLAQYIMVRSGYAFEMGRYMPGRSGIPSLTAEASYFGSLSLIQAMYLLELGWRRNAPFVLMGFLSVILSGSVLAILLLVFPLWRLALGWRIFAIAGTFLLAGAEYAISGAGVVARLIAILSGDSGVAGAVGDASLNLRFGHIYFTLVENLIPSIFYYSPVSFMEQYNEFALRSGIFMPTGSDFILPAIGELLYGGGIIAGAIFLILLARAAQGGVTIWLSAQRMAFVVACMLNPISIANPFLIAYVQGAKTGSGPS